MRHLLIHLLIWLDRVTEDWRIVAWMNRRINERHPPEPPERWNVPGEVEVYENGAWLRKDSS